MLLFFEIGKKIKNINDVSRTPLFDWYVGFLFSFFFWGGWWWVWNLDVEHV